MHHIANFLFSNVQSYKKNTLHMQYYVKTEPEEVVHHTPLPFNVSPEFREE